MRRTTTQWLAIGATLTFTAALAADPVETTIGPNGGGNDELQLRLMPGTDDDTGIRIRNLSAESSTVRIERIGGSLQGQATTGSPFSRPFQLIDNTLLRVTAANLPAEEQRLRVRIEFDARRLRRKGLDPKTVHVMRRDLRRQEWFPAVFANRSLRNFRFFNDARATFLPANFGIDVAGGNAWVVLDRNSDYALAAVAIPEPAAVALIAGGVVLLLSARPRRRMRPAG